MEQVLDVCVAHKHCEVAFTIDLPRYIALYQAGRLPVDRLLTHRLKLEEVNEAFDRLARGEAVRQVIVFD